MALVQQERWVNWTELFRRLPASKIVGRDFEQPDLDAAFLAWPGVAPVNSSAPSTIISASITQVPSTAAPLLLGDALLPVERLTLELPAIAKFGVQIHNFKNLACTVPIFLVFVIGAIITFMLRKDREFSRTNDLLSLSIAALALAAILDMAQYRATIGTQHVPMGTLSAILTAGGIASLTLWIWRVAEGDGASGANVETSPTSPTCSTFGYTSFRRHPSSCPSVLTANRSIACDTDNDKEKRPTSTEFVLEDRTITLPYSGPQIRYIAARNSVRSSTFRRAYHTSAHFGRERRRLEDYCGPPFRSPWVHVYICMLVYAGGITEAIGRILIMFRSTAEAAYILMRLASALNVALLVILNLGAIARLSAGRALTSIGADHHLRDDGFIDMASGVRELERRAQQALVVLVIGSSIGIVSSVLNQAFLGFTGAPAGRCLFMMQMMCCLFTAFRTARITSEICSRSQQLQLRSLRGMQDGDVQPGILQEVVVSASKSTRAPVVVPGRALLRSEKWLEPRLSTIISVDDHSNSVCSPPQSPAMPPPGLNSSPARNWTLPGRDKFSTAWQRGAGYRKSALAGRLRTLSTPAGTTLTEVLPGGTSEARSYISDDSKSSSDIPATGHGDDHLPGHQACTTSFGPDVHVSAEGGRDTFLIVKGHPQRQRLSGSAPVSATQPEEAASKSMEQTMDTI
ncbi:unnamed protein product [Tilletia laevis]|uniref:Uncharacterized protein n=2 Tax=Tilletia TaxID=13289 RepID=A0A8X7MWP3_9BASI|nr:hypothetical protein CF336_g990 [Tilletia laevis]KAE8252745.1 hypothetical protein A4X06_0g1960 [Tilletia controversa]KAE8263056.1 hypothetical protein A4X03_0g1964 [Tilletia caries]KAE8208123.1 hypothetical protein CF335_g652 [Tilletia laevis]CAD6908682.1 unnamed protein product [Tilletia controversa]